MKDWMSFLQSIVMSFLKSIIEEAGEPPSVTVKIVEGPGFDKLIRVSSLWRKQDKYGPRLGTAVYYATPQGIVHLTNEARRIKFVMSMCTGKGKKRHQLILNILPYRDMLLKYDGSWEEFDKIFVPVLQDDCSDLSAKNAYYESESHSLVWVMHRVNAFNVIRTWLRFVLLS
ncbi:MAG: hypothetical protein ABIH21_05245 [Patescibacteria group bacterium]